MKRIFLEKISLELCLSFPMYRWGNWGPNEEGIWKRSQCSLTGEKRQRCESSILHPCLSHTALKHTHEWGSLTWGHKLSYNPLCKHTRRHTIPGMCLTLYSFLSLVPMPGIVLSLILLCVNLERLLHLPKCPLSLPPCGLLHLFPSLPLPRQHLIISTTR
jgi:hypothetical protein